jgi:fibronectin type 3 domain-containing protein
MRYLLILFLSISSFGATLLWDPHPDTNVTSFGVYRAKDTNGPFVLIANTIGTNFSLTTQPTGKYVYAVTAITADGTESVLSETAGWTNRPNAPGRPRITWNIEGSSDPLGPWTNVAELVSTETASNHGFFRGKLSTEE